MTKSPDHDQAPLHEIAEELGALARSGIEMQQAGLDILMAEVKLALHVLPGSHPPIAPEKTLNAAEDPGDDLFDNMPV